MSTRLIRKRWNVDGVLTNVTSATLEDPTGSYGIKRNDTDEVVVAAGTPMLNPTAGVYEYSFQDLQNVAYTAYVKFVYLGSSFYFDVDIPGRPDVGAMVASYYSLMERVGHFAFGVRSGFTSEQTEDIEDCIRDGLHDVYIAHQWSFFRPVKHITTSPPYSEGTVEIVDGVVTLTAGTFPYWAAVAILKVDKDVFLVATRDNDTQITLDDTSVNVAAGAEYELGRMEYDLPASCETIEGDLTYLPWKSDLFPPIHPRHEEEIRRKIQKCPELGRPLYYGIRTADLDQTVGSRRRVVLYPTPDASYVLRARLKLRATMVDEVNCYPIGAETLTQLITEACLAAAERNFDDLGGVHTKRFEELLPQAIQEDMLDSSPTELGPDRPGIHDRDEYARSIQVGDVIFNGEVM